MPHFIVESIEFDFSDSMGTIPEEEQKFITENTLGLWWVDSEWLDPEEALIEKITEKRGGALVQLVTVRTDPTR